jgi:hypothetical protein
MCPYRGISASSVGSGSMDASLRACSGGRSRSRSPTMTSVGTVTLAIEA